MTYQITILHISHNTNSPAPRTEMMGPYDSADEAKIVAASIQKMFAHQNHAINYWITGGGTTEPGETNLI